MLVDPVTPLIPLRILMVLPSDFDKPSKVDPQKTYEKVIPFEMDLKTRTSLHEHIPGFIENSFYDQRKKLLQVNCWVCA